MIPGYVLQIIVMVFCGWGSGKYGSRLTWILSQLVRLPTLLLLTQPLDFLCLSSR